MKTRMKKLISIKSVPLLALVLLIVSGFTLAPPGREPISICGVVELETFSGTAIVVVGGEAVPGTVQVVPLKPPYEKDGVTHYPEIMHAFDFGDGNVLNTVGAEFAVSEDDNPEILTLHGNMEITSGSGIFEGVSGELRVNGQMNLSLGQATFNAKGTISR